MSKEEIFFISTGQSMKDAEQGQLFGKPCFKINGKAFICFFQEEMVFKLKGDMHNEALRLSGSKLFDPSGKKRPMKEWVQVGFEHKNEWALYACEAMNYVNGK